MFIACECTLPQIESGANPDASGFAPLSIFIKSATCAYKHSAPTERPLFDFDEVTKRVKTRLADAANHHQVFGAAEWSVFLAMLDDAFGQTFAYSGKRFEFFDGRGVYFDALRSLRS